VTAGLYLSALVMAILGLGLLTLHLSWIASDDARILAWGCLAVSAVDVMSVHYLKWIWRKRDGS